MSGRKEFFGKLKFVIAEFQQLFFCNIVIYVAGCLVWTKPLAMKMSILIWKPNLVRCQNRIPEIMSVSFAQKNRAEINPLCSHQWRREVSIFGFCKFFGGCVDEFQLWYESSQASLLINVKFAWDQCPVHPIAVDYRRQRGELPASHLLVGTYGNFHLAPTNFASRFGIFQNSQRSVSDSFVSIQTLCWEFWVTSVATHASHLHKL